MTDHLSPTALTALKDCFATRGPNKGRFLSRAPSQDKNPNAHAAWHGAMLSINPFKASVGAYLFMSHDERVLHQEVMAFFDARPELRGLDKDRAALERLGVW